MERCYGYAIDAAGTLEIAPSCSVTVYNTGTLTLATIYADQINTPKSNPFLPDAYGYFYFYAPAGRYDVRFSGPGITTAFTWGDIQLQDTYLLAKINAENTFMARQTFNDDVTIYGDLLINGGPFIEGGRIPAISSSYFANMSGQALISLNATELTTGTLPSARVRGLYSEALILSSTANVFAGDTLALGTAPSDTGTIRLSYNEGIYSKNSTNVDTLMLKLGSSDKLELMSMATEHFTPKTDDTYNIGEIAVRYRNGHIKDIYSSMLAFGTSLMATVGAIRLGNDSTYAIAFRNAADSANKLFYVNASDQFVLDSTTTITGSLLPTTDEAYDLGSSSKAWRNLQLDGTATIATLKVGNALQLQLAGGTYAALIDVNGSDQLVLGDGSHDIKLAKAIVAPNSGAATLGVLPAGSSAFYGWLKFIDSTGTSIWVPCFS